MPHPAVQDIQWLQSLTSDEVADWHHALVARRNPSAPRWLDLCAHAVQHLADAAQLKDLLDHCDAVNDLLALDPVTAVDDPWHEPPGTRLHRVGAVVMQALGGKVALPEPTPLLEVAPLAIEAAWLRDAARQALHEADPALRWRPPAAAPDTDDVRAHALLVTWQPADKAVWVARGMLAHLHLRVVPATDACLRLVPMPRSACTALARSFAQALDNVRQWLWRTLRHDVPGLPLTHLALAWDLHFERPHGALEDGVSNLAGPSAGVVFALAALRALQAAAPPGLAALLARLPMDALFDLWATAALAPDGSLGTVGGTGAKTLALAPLLQALVDSPAGPHAACVHVASGQRQLAGSLPGAPPLVEHTTIADLLRDLPGRLEPPDPAAERLHRLLLGTDPRPQPADADLRHVAGPMPTPTLARWLLKQWARWALREGGQVHAHYVRLQVRRGPGQATVQEGTPRELPALLQDYDADGHQAYVLRGQPGAGKTTLLRHHLMALSRTALGQLQQAPGTAAQPLTELPLYLPLAGLRADEDPLQWVRQQLQAAGAPAEVRAWFSPGARRPAGCCVRLLLDGINELPVRDGQERHERAAEVVQALHTLLKTSHGTVPLPPMLLSIRQHHADSLAGVDLLRVDVLDWTDAEVQAYLQLRFPTPPGTPDDAAPWRPRWAELAAPGNAAALALCRLPLNLAGQCDLWQAGYPHPVRYRAALYTAWLWLRLRRALGYGPGLSAEAVAAGRQRANDWRRQGLLSPRDALRIASADAWLDPHPANLPQEGTLLPHLMQQAENQYWDDAGAGRTAALRCATIQPLTRVVPWISDADAHAQWRSAVAELGLAVVDETAGSFEYAHPSWGEFLASVRLLAGAPPAWVPGLPATAWQRLLRRAPRVDLPPTVARLHAACQAARWPGPNDRGDAEELAHLNTHASAAWQRALPLLQALVDAPLEVPLDAVLGHLFTAPPGTSREALLGALRERYAGWLSKDEGGDGTLRVHADAGLCWVDLRVWGDTTEVSEAVGLADSRAWAASASGWQVLAHEKLWPPVRTALWAALTHLGVDGDTLQRLQAEPGRLGGPPVADIDEVLALALTGLADLAPWLTWLLAAGHGPRLGSAVAVLAARLERDDDEAKALPAAPGLLPRAPRPWRGTASPVLQHWRRLLLLHSLDAGAGLHRRLRAGGWWAVLQQPLTGLPPLLQAHWPQALRSAFNGPGLDLRLRLQAADWLGTLGDTLRLQWATGTARTSRAGDPNDSRPGSPDDSRPVAGLRLHPALWVPVGQPGRRTRFLIGAPVFAQLPSERPVFATRLPGFAAAAQPVTVQEWRCFAACGGYDPAAPWWRDAGPAAQAWLRQYIRYGQPLQARCEGWPGFNGPLQPATGISQFEALAYARWASALQPVQPGVDQPLQVPTELQWEALARGPAPRWRQGWGMWPWQPWGWPHRRSTRAPGALDFNHAATRLGRTSAVGVFSASLSRQGLADLAGNVWERCSSVLTAAQRERGWQRLDDRQMACRPAGMGDAATDRALRGGAFNDTADCCRPAIRDHSTPVNHNYIIGVRLVRLWLPHSGPRTPSA